MRAFWIVQAGIGVAAIAASAALGVACSGAVVGTDTGSDTGTPADTSTEIDTSTETETDYTPPTPGPSCQECACVWKSGDTPAGCADTCTDDGYGGPNFCYGANATMMCQMCIAQRCGVSDPTQCN